MKSKPFQLPEEGFSQEEESGFRNELMNRVEGMSVDTGSVADLSNPIASSSVKRQLLSAPPLGQVEVDENFQALGLKDASGYMNASKTFTGVSGTFAKNQANWVSTLTSWTSNTASDWTESSGAFSYAGDFPASGSRVFAVSYAFSIYGASSAQYWRMMGKLTKTSGGSTADVAGSIQSTSQYGSQIAFGNYFMTHSLAAGSIVSVSSGDSITFQYGHWVVHGGAADADIANLKTQDGTSGVTLTIRPVDQ